MNPMPFEPTPDEIRQFNRESYWIGAASIPFWIGLMFLARATGSFGMLLFFGTMIGIVGWKHNTSAWAGLIPSIIIFAFLTP